jgi:hypothetical protein
MVAGLLIVGLAAAGAAAASPRGSSSRAATPAGFTMTLKGPPKVDKRYVQGGLGNGWQIPDAGGHVSWTPHFGTAIYEWNMPKSIKPGGTELRMTVTVKASATSRFAPAMGVEGSIVKGQRVTVGALAEPGESATETVTATLLPSQSARSAEVTVGIQDGPRYTYTYAPNLTSVSVDLSYGVREPGKQLSPGQVAIGTAIQLVARATPGIPEGARLVILDRPQGPLPPNAGPFGFLVPQNCSGSSCQADRVERHRPRTHAYRAFVFFGEIGKPSLKVLGKSKPVVIAWDEPHVPVELLVRKTVDSPYEPSAKVPVGTRVTLRADVEGRLPEGALIRISYLRDGRPQPATTCGKSPCLREWRVRRPASYVFTATVIFFSASLAPREREWGRSKPVPVTWAG